MFRSEINTTPNSRERLDKTTKKKSSKAGTSFRFVIIAVIFDAAQITRAVLHALENV